MKAWQHYSIGTDLLRGAPTQTAVLEAIAHYLAALVVLRATDEPNTNFPDDWTNWRELVT